ncbi:RcnB family protein [Ottowia thiooxydans]|uniref:RcnB family protein n=1 Tax=Ottowia thiooxydans TaxID=219182 RepID=UPI000418C48D|nr:RcnB family protein [Ottowia thiooxydans]
MNARSIIALTAVAFGMSAGVANAQPQSHERRDRDHRQEQARQPSRDAQHPGRHAGPQRAPDYRQPVVVHGRPPIHQADRGRGAGPDRRFYRGERLPAYYRTNHYVVQNWRGHHLSAPPRGHRWVQVGSDYVLIAVATGVITQLVFGN